MPMTGKEVEVEVTRLNDQMQQLGLETRFTFAKGGRGTQHRLYSKAPGRDEDETKIGSNLVVALMYVRGLRHALDVAKAELERTLGGLYGAKIINRPKGMPPTAGTFADPDARSARRAGEEVN